MNTPLGFFFVAVEFESCLLPVPLVDLDEDNLLVLVRLLLVVFDNFGDKVANGWLLCSSNLLIVVLSNGENGFECSKS